MELGYLGLLNMLFKGSLLHKKMNCPTKQGRCHNSQKNKKIDNIKHFFMNKNH